MIRYYIIAKGRVQGVGFRFFTINTASKYNLTGSVRNMDNGMVEIEVQGEKNNINKFISEIKEGNYFIRVDDLAIKSIPLKPEEKSFKMKY